MGAVAAAQAAVATRAWVKSTHDVYLTNWSVGAWALFLAIRRRIKKNEKYKKNTFYFEVYICVYIGSRSPRWTSGSPRMLLMLIHEFESRRGEVSIFFAKIWKDQLLAAHSVGKHNSTRVERKKNWKLLAIKNSRHEPWRGEEPATWPRIWVTTRRETEHKGEDNKCDGKPPQQATPYIRRYLRSLIYRCHLSRGPL